jgi:prophage tail gpP-like protein
VPDFRVVVNGQSYGGWKEASVTRTIEALAGSFEVVVSEKWPGEPTRREINPGDACEVTLDGEVVLSGFVDDVNGQYAPGSDGGDGAHEVAIAGRDATGDLVDCSHVGPPNEWTGQRIDAITRAICTPFGIPVTVADGTDIGAPLARKFTIQQGETAYEAIERMARTRAVLAVSDGRGGLVLTRAGTSKATTALVLGENILSASGLSSLRERFRDYTVKGQLAGTDAVHGTQASGPAGVALDPIVQRYRPLVVVAEEQADIATCRTRAQWEANVRAGRGRRATYRVQGWKHKGGLWRPNELVNVLDPLLGIAMEMLVVTVRHAIASSGSTTEIEVVRPEAYALVPLPEAKPKDEVTNPALEALLAIIRARRQPK